MTFRNYLCKKDIQGVLLKEFLRQEII